MRKKRTFAFSICFAVIISFWLPVARMSSQERLPDYKNPQLSVDVRVADLLSRMTLEEKVGHQACLAFRAARSLEKSSPAWWEERVSGLDDTRRNPLDAAIVA